MLEFCLAGIAGLAAYYRYINKEDLKKKKHLRQLKNSITNKWNLCMKYANIKNSNDETFGILDVIPKEYGADCIISIPIGLNAKKIFDNISMIEQNFACKVYINISSKGNTIYSRFVLNPEDINELNDIRCKWNKIMLSDNKLYNQDLNTFKIDKIKKQEKYGYDLTISIPIGKSISNIEAIKEIIETHFKCKVYINDIPNQNNKFILKLITKEFSDDYKFTPLKVSSTQLYIGMTYDFRPVIVDLKDFAHMLYTGMNGSGKTACLLTALTNLIYYNDDSKWELYMAMISSKKDLRIFKDVKQCKYYAETLQDAYLLLKYLYKQMDYRNKLFASDKENCIVNIYEWNQKHPHKKLKDIIFATDEISFFMPDDFDLEEDKTLKSKCINLFNRLLKEGRSAGLHVLGSLQRPDRENLPPIMKSQMGIKVVFYQPNTASSLVVLDSDEATKLKKKREAIVDADERYFMKTLYITPDMIQHYIKKYIELNHQYIDITNSTQKNQENTRKNTIISKNNEKISNNSKKINKNNKTIQYSMPRFNPNNKRK